MSRVRVKIKSKVVRSTINNKDVMDMFHGVLGTGGGGTINMKVAYPKYLKIEKNCNSFIALLRMFGSTNLLRSLFPEDARRLEEYAERLDTERRRAFTAPDLTAHRNGDYTAMEKEERDAFAEIYNKSKESGIINTIVITCSNLTPHAKSLSDEKTLSDSFLVRSGGLTFAPIAGLTGLNFKKIYIDTRLDDSQKKYVLTVLHKLYQKSHDLYETMSSPDIDVEDFVNIIINSLDDIKRQIPRCNEAFNKIRDSVGILKNNFGGYYKDFVASNNPTVIMENFVLDVASNTKSSPKVTAQFRKIIGHYQKIAQQQAKNPQMQTLFAHVNKNFQELEKRTRAAAGSDEEGEDEDPSADPASEEPQPAVEKPEPTQEELAKIEAKRAKNKRKRLRQKEKKKAEAPAEALAEASAEVPAEAPAEPALEQD